MDNKNDQPVVEEMEQSESLADLDDRDTKNIIQDKTSSLEDIKIKQGRQESEAEGLKPLVKNNQVTKEACKKLELSIELDYSEATADKQSSDVAMSDSYSNENELKHEVSVLTESNSENGPDLNGKAVSVDKTESDIEKCGKTARQGVEIITKSPVATNMDLAERNIKVKTTTGKIGLRQPKGEEGNENMYGRDRKSNRKSSISRNVDLEVKEDAVMSKSPKSAFTSPKADKSYSIHHKDDTILPRERKAKASGYKMSIEDTNGKAQSTSQMTKSTAYTTESRDKRLLKMNRSTKQNSPVSKIDDLEVKQCKVKSTSPKLTSAIESSPVEKSGDTLEIDKETKTNTRVNETEDAESTSVADKTDRFCRSFKRNDKLRKENTNVKTQPLIVDAKSRKLQAGVKSPYPKTSPKLKTDIKHNSPNNRGIQLTEYKTVKTKPPKDEDQGRTSKSEKLCNPEKHAVKLLKQKQKNKTAYLYLRFDQLMKNKSAVHDFLTKRLQKSESIIVFQLLESVQSMDENYTVVTLEFSSKSIAQTAQRLLNLSNRHNSLRIFSTFDLSQIDESKKKTRNVAIFKQQLSDISRRAAQIMGRHQEKVNTTTESLKILKSKKQMSIAEFEAVTSQRLALEDKLKELSLQIAEFKNFLQSLTSKLTKCWEDNTYDKYINEIRSLFGMEYCRLESALPMYAQRKEIIKLVKENQVCVILGETGSGKSTQVVQYLYQVGFGNDGIIVCTQPRKVAAISLATRVASEMNTNVGQLVGYRVGMKSKFGGSTKILYTTDHALLNDSLQDPSLSKYSCVIIDEAHERSIYTDLLLGMLKRCISGRPELKVIITSATIDPDVFVRYFNSCPVLKVSGRMFPVEVVWESKGDEVDVFENYQDAAVEKAAYIHSNKPFGDVLVFMTTPLETERCRDSLKRKLKNDNSYVCLVLHGQVQVSEQQQVFQPAPQGQRKIVFATNSAETSITIPGIKYVVDTGLVKEKRYDAKRNMDSLNVYMISRSSAEQRKGRAGRTGPGTCYRLYSKELYQSMQCSSAPEILRVHLGQALLKLADMGINPHEYDFVESPDKTAITEAMRLLEDIGAMKNECITETGKFLTKLPVEPRHGMIIAKGKQHDMIYEAIILSVVSSTGNSVFYRGGTQTEKTQADLLKLKFCHYGGDSLTMLNVYRQWDKQPEKKKTAWCFENKINSKVIRGVRDTVNEICSVLNKAFHLVIKHSADDTSKTDKLLQNILFECFSSNICHFLGHERAGYYSVSLNQLVHIHPSSVMKPLGLFPQWVSFEHVLKTSKDFVTGITPVDDSVVVAAVENGTLSYDIEEMKHKQVYRVYTECVGSRAFWSIVGPRFSKMRILEETADVLAAPSVAVVEADKEKGEISIFSTDDCSKTFHQLFKADINKVGAELEHEDCEFSLSEQTESVKVVIGMGGEVAQVIMPDDYRTVIIENPLDDTTEDVILAKFERFGVIKTCKEFKTWNNNRWGCVTFEQADDAKSAVQATQDDTNLTAVVRNRGRGEQQSAFKAKLTWCRRKSRGFAFVDISCMAPDAYTKLIENSPIYINMKRVHVNANTNKVFSLHLRPLTFSTNESDIKSKLLTVLDEDADSDVIERITVVRDNVETTSLMLDSITSRIKTAVLRHAPSKNFTVKVVEPNPKAINYLAFVRFCHPDEGQTACKMVPRCFEMESMGVKMVPDISAEIYIEASVMEVVKTDLEDSIEHFSNLADITSLKLKQLKHGNFVVDIHAACTSQMADVRSCLQSIIQGDVLELRNCPLLKHMFTRNGRKHLDKLQSQLKCLIILDNRTMSISIKGNSKIKNKVRSSIDNFLEAIAEGKSKEIYLKGPDKPGGVMKMLTLKYGIDLERFRQEMGLLSVQMDFRRHKLELRGPAEAIEKADSVIAEITAELVKLLSVQLQESKRPECVVCFMPVEQGQLYRLESCGHPYCMDCVKQQMHHALMNRDFPIDCVQEQCLLHFMWRDVSNIIRDGSVVATDLVANAVSAFVASHHTQYRYCITPNCPVIYRVSSDGSRFLCGECQMQICTSCHVQYHDGLSCAMYKSPDEEGDRLFYEWMEKQNNLMPCPSCGIPVEKMHGCNKMKCKACKKAFCWKCKEVFDSSQLCYAHLKRHHGSFY